MAEPLPGLAIRAGIALYTRFGFVQEGKMVAYAYRGGRYVDALAMARLRGLP